VQGREEQKLIDMEQVHAPRLERVESSGIILPRRNRQDRRPRIGPRPGREPRRRCSGTFCPIVEGTTVNRAHGFVRNGPHSLHRRRAPSTYSKPSEPDPRKLQGRFPIRVELKSLTVEDFIRILKEPKNALAKPVHGRCWRRKASS